MYKNKQNREKTVKKNRLKSNLKQISHEFEQMWSFGPLILICGGASALAGIISRVSGGNRLRMLHMLKLPALLPPGWFFFIVWTAWYFLLGAALACVLTCREARRRRERSFGILMFFVYFLFNLIWYPIFFGSQAVFVAFLDMLIMAACCWAVMRHFMRVHLLAGCIFALHLVWIVYLLYLNISVLFLN